MDVRAPRNFFMALRVSTTNEARSAMSVTAGSRVDFGARELTGIDGDGVEHRQLPHQVWWPIRIGRDADEPIAQSKQTHDLGC